MQTLIVDNYDSFTFNLAQAVGRINGRAPLVVRNDELSWRELTSLDFDNVIISPGPGDPNQERDFGISRRVVAELEVPLLGVCLGHQGICCAFGGKIARAPEPVHGRASSILHDGRDPLFAGLPSPFRAVRYHSLIIEEPLPECLRRIAWTEDGLLMAVRHVERPMWGVQFHPESIGTEYGDRLIENFLRCGAARQSRRSRQPATPAPASMRVLARRMPLTVAPATIFRQLFSEERYAFWLDSAMTETGQARFSFLGAVAEETGEVVTYRCGEGRQEVLSYLAEKLAARRVDTPELPFPFACGYVGYLGYEIKADCGASAAHRSSLADAVFLFADRMVVIDHLENSLWVVGCAPAEEWLDACQRRIEKLHDAPTQMERPLGAAPSYRFAISKPDYARCVEECLELIRAGQSYEICLTNQLRLATEVSPLAYYETLRQRNPAPYSAFLSLGGMQVACSSPERFLRVTPEGDVESRPIKGTIRRGRDQTEDAALRAHLAADEKNRAENLMIVDLVRNDLGRVCQLGSVRVPRLMQVETYATVHHLVSTITGTLAAGKSAIDCVRAAFPGGSMTGAPKLRTMEILDRLEPEARGVYSGSIGYLGLNGSADLNIVIRTAVFEGGRASIGVGGAIVANSDPEREWAEINLKARALLDAFRAAG